MAATLRDRDAYGTDRWFASRERRDAAVTRRDLFSLSLSFFLSLLGEGKPRATTCFDRSTKPSAPRYRCGTEAHFMNFLQSPRVLSMSPSDAPIVRRRICMINRRASRAGIGRSVKRTMTDASVTNLVAQNALSASKLCISRTAALQITRRPARACAYVQNCVTWTCPNSVVKEEINYRSLAANYICHLPAGGR